LRFLLDTNAIIRYFCEIPGLGKQAKRIITEAEENQHHLYVSIISLMEIMYLAEKNRITLTLDEIVEALNSKQCYSIVEFDLAILREAEKIRFYELHDRLILATASLLGTPIISSDQKFREIEHIEVIW